MLEQYLVGWAIIPVCIVTLASVLVLLSFSESKKRVNVNKVGHTNNNKNKTSNLNGYKNGGLVRNGASTGVTLEEEETVDGDLGFEEEARFVSYSNRLILSEKESLLRSSEFYELMNRRRTVRMFSKNPVQCQVVENIIRAAGTGPSGAHTEPWTFLAISDPELKAEIRHIVEHEEQINYERRMGQAWVTALKKLASTWCKAYLEDAPYLLLVFVQTHGWREDGSKKTHYYHQISTSMASGILLAAIHYAGLVTVTSTPMNAGPALLSLLERPSNEKLLLLLPIGYPADDVMVPDLHRKPLSEISVFK